MASNLAYSDLYNLRLANKKLRTVTKFELKCQTFENLAVTVTIEGPRWLTRKLTNEDAFQMMKDTYFDCLGAVVEEKLRKALHKFLAKTTRWRVVTIVCNKFRPDNPPNYTPILNALTELKANDLTRIELHRGLLATEGYYTKVSTTRFDISAVLRLLDASKVQLEVLGINPEAHSDDRWAETLTLAHDHMQLQNLCYHQDRNLYDDMRLLRPDSTAASMPSL